MRCIPNKEERMLAHAPERVNRRKIAVLDLRLDKKNYVLATNSYLIYPKDHCLYYRFKNGLHSACAVYPTLQGVLLTPLSQKRGQLKYTFHMTRKFVAFDGEATELVDYLGDFSENAYAEDQILTIQINSRIGKRQTSATVMWKM
jgi:hypothetical protein